MRVSICMLLIGGMGINGRSTNYEMKSKTNGPQLRFAPPTIVGRTVQREDPRYFYCMSDACCFGNFGGSVQTTTSVLDGWTVYSQPGPGGKVSSKWHGSTSRKFGPGPEVFVQVNESFGFDMGDMCAPFATHHPFYTPRTTFMSEWHGITTVNESGAAHTHRINSSVTFNGLPHPAIRLQAYKAIRVTFKNEATRTVMLMGAWYSSVPTSKPPCCNETVVAFELDKTSVGVDGVPRIWNYIGQVASRSQLSEPMGEGPNEATMVQLPNGDLFAVIRTDGGDGPQHQHRGFIGVYSYDGGRSWAQPFPLGPTVGSARPQAVFLGESTLVVSGGRPGLNLWATVDGWQSHIQYNLPRVHNSLLAPAGLSPTEDAFCDEFISQSDLKNGLENATWSQSSGYTGFSSINETSAMLCYDTADGSTGGYSGPIPPQCKKAAAAVYCMIVSVYSSKFFLK